MIFHVFVGLAAACQDLDPWSDERFDAESRVEVSREGDTLKFSCYEQKSYLRDQKYPSYNGGKVLNEIQDGVGIGKSFLYKMYIFTPLSALTVNGHGLQTSIKSHAST